MEEHDEMSSDLSLTNSSPDPNDDALDTPWKRNVLQYAPMPDHAASNNLPGSHPPWLPLDDCKTCLTAKVVNNIGEILSAHGSQLINMSSIQRNQVSYVVGGAVQRAFDAGQEYAEVDDGKDEEEEGEEEEEEDDDDDDDNNDDNDLTIIDEPIYEEDQGMDIDPWAPEKPHITNTPIGRAEVELLLAEALGAIEDQTRTICILGGRMQRLDDVTSERTAFKEQQVLVEAHDLVGELVKGASKTMAVYQKLRMARGQEWKDEVMDVLDEAMKGLGC